MTYREIIEWRANPKNSKLTKDQQAKLYDKSNTMQLLVYVMKLGHVHRWGYIFFLNLYSEAAFFYSFIWN